MPLRKRLFETLAVEWFDVSLSFKPLVLKVSFSSYICVK